MNGSLLARVLHAAAFAPIACAAAVVGPGGSAVFPVEFVEEPAYIVTFEGALAFDASRRSSADIRADSRPGGTPKRAVMEFALPNLDGALLDRATLSILPFGQSAGQAPLVYSIFGFGGDGIVSTGEGLGGTEVAGPFPIDADISQVDVLPFVRAVMAAGNTHVGFALRDVNTELNTISSELRIASAAGGRPPLLVIQALVPEPSGPLLLLLGLIPLARRRRPGRS